MKATQRLLTALLLITLNALLVAQTVTTVYVKDKSAASQTDVPVTFALPFLSGDVPSGTTLSARLTDNTPISVQVIKKATHLDGSLRHAIFSMKVPALAANEKKAIQIYKGGSAPSGSAVSVADLLATSFDATVSIIDTIRQDTLNVSARTLLQTTTPVVWQSGPVATEWIVKSESDSFLAVYFHIRAYAGCQTVRVDAIVENCWTWKPGWGNLMYNVTIASGANTVYTKKKFYHYAHARWRQTFFWGRDPKALVSFDRTGLIKTRAVPNYDTTQTPSAATITAFQTAYVPMQTSLIYPDMPATGGRSDIGCWPTWAATYLLTMADTLWTSITSVGSAAGSFSVHYRDDYTGNVLSLGDWPDFFIHSNYPAGTDVNTIPAPGANASGSPYTADCAHEPMLSYLPYLLTGDFFYLEEMEFWVLDNSLHTLGIYRGSEKGQLSFGQERGAAWGMRELGQLAFIMPDDHPTKAHYNMQVNANFDDFAAREADNALGIAVCSYGPQNRQIAPWQDDMFTWTMGYLTYMGAWPKAKEQLEFKVKFPIGRMTATDFCWIWACAYWPYVQDASNNIFGSFGEYAAANSWSVSPCRATGNMADSSGNDYPFQMYAAMSYVPKTSVTNAQAAYTKFMTIVTTIPSGTDTWQSRPKGFTQWAVVPPADPIPTVSVEQFNTHISSGKKALLACYPNPFNPSVTLSLSGISGLSNIKMAVYDLSGKRIADLSGSVKQGIAVWNAAGRPSGIYVVKATAGNKSLTKKIMLVK